MSEVDVKHPVLVMLLVGALAGIGLFEGCRFIVSHVRVEWTQGRKP